MGDITAGPAAARADGERAALCDAVLDALSAHVAILDETGRIVAVNRAWRRFADANGASASSVGVGANYLAICRDGEDHEAREARAAAEGIRAVIAGERDGFHLEYPCHSDVEERWFQMRVTAIDGEPRRIVVAHESITETRGADAQARKFQARMAHLLRLHTISEMAAGLAHELNQPIGAIANYAAGAARRIEGGRGDEESTLSALRDIAVQAERAGEILRRVRSFARPDFGAREEADINEIVRDAVRLVRSDGSLVDAEARIELDEELPRIRMDAVQVQQVVANLARNALEAMGAHREREPGARCVLRVRTRRADPRMAEVEVSDTGPGVAQEGIARLFDPFYTTKDSGLGLGLSLSRSIVDAHGGTFRAMRADGGGMTFSFTLPIVDGESHADERVGGDRLHHR